MDAEKDKIAAIRCAQGRDRGAAEERPSEPNAMGISKAAELRYGTSRRSGKAARRSSTSELVELQQRAQVPKEEVDEEDIAEVVSRWTGVPVSKLMEGEVAKAHRDGERTFTKRVIGQDDAVEAVSNAIRRARSGLRTPTVRSDRSCSWGPRASARPSSPGRLPSSCSTTNAPWSAST